MYIAGLKFPTPSPQWLEVLIVLSTADYIQYNIAKIKDLAVISESKGGHVRLESMPPTFLGHIITPIHELAILLPPLIYVDTLVLNQFEQPEWMVRFVFSPEMLNSMWRNTLRVVACTASLTLRCFTDCIFEHLGDQWHTIRHHEKPRIVKTGPYAWVHHPGYSSVLLQEAL
ncbi:hypothetical protein HD554DRAFT_2294790, partial [Boletus coccyginus]